MSHRPTVVSLFSGGGGFDLGAQAAGFEIAGALERCPKIAEWYALNLGHQPVVKAIEDAQPADFDCAPDWLHASPPCQGDSIARQSAKTEHPDRAAGLEVCRFIREWKPAYFTLENVTGYAKNPALHAIEDCLLECGYWVRRIQIDASDYGVPQSRTRLYVVAHRAEDVPAPVLPNPSAQKVGWYEAIQDLIPSLSETHLYSWQQKSVEKKPPAGIELISSCNTDNPVRRHPHEPAPTILKHKDSCRPKIYRPGAAPLFATPRCGARFQRFPDSYHLPQSATLAGALIGNAVPPRIAQLIGLAIWQSLNS